MFVGLIWSCKKDDDGPDAVVVPLQSLSETAIENDAEIKAYLETHFYNYEEFDNPAADFDYKVRLDTIEGDNADKTPIIEMTTRLKTEVINVPSSNFDQDEGDVPHTLYYLEVSEGAGENPTIVDSLYLKYEGSLLNGKIFDSKIGSPVWFDLQGTGTSTNPGVINGFKKGLPLFKSGDNIVLNDNGTFQVENSGIGVLFMPSGLAYFSGTQVGPSYSPIIFKIELLVTNIADHDRDGVPTIFEDLDNDENLFNDDTDENGLPDYLDNDDDGDGRPTIEEIDIDEEGNVIFRDTDGDGIKDHLDSDS